MDKNSIRNVLESKGYIIALEKRYKNISWRFKLTNGVSVFCGDGNKVWCQGAKKEIVLADLEHIIAKQNNSKIFVVYGRDENAKTEMIEMIEGWGLEALTIDRLPTLGRTVIEQLEHYIPETNYGIVLATPDDIGYLDDGSEQRKHRARQNVVMELGMLFSKLGRSRVSVLIRKTNDFEKPSDIEGILYKEYETSVFEQQDSIKRELIALGYHI